MIHLYIYIYSFIQADWFEIFFDIYLIRRKIPDFEFDVKNFVFRLFFQMAINVLVIVEFGAQKQRISINSNSSYNDICHQIYSLFNLDYSKSKYILQRQNSTKPESFTNMDDRIFMNDLRYYSANNIKSPVIRLRLVPPGFKTSVTK